jgi:hypothetical protein
MIGKAYSTDQSCGAESGQSTYSEAATFFTYSEAATSPDAEQQVGRHLTNLF